MPLSSARTRLIGAAGGLRRAVARREGLDQAVGARAPLRRRHDCFDALHLPQLRHDRCPIGSVLDEHDERLHHAGRDARVSQSGPALDRAAGAREVLRLRLARVQLDAVEDEHRHDRETDRSNRHGPSHDEVGPAAPQAVFRMATVHEPLREQPEAVDPRPQHGEQRRQQRDGGDHRDRRDQHSTDPDRTDERQRQHEHREQADGHGRPRDDHRPPRMRHRLDERGLDVLALTQLVAEAEDHQQRVVDRDAEADQRNQELDDDRDIGDVGQDPDEREGVENRRYRDRERDQHRRHRPEHEEQDHEATEAADQRFGEDARAAVVTARRGLVKRVATGQVRLHAGGCTLLQLSAHLRNVHRRAEGRRSRRVDLRERRVPVLRDVGVAVGRPVRRDAGARVDLRRVRDRLLNARLVPDLAVRVEDSDERGLLPGPEGL